MPRAIRSRAGRSRPASRRPRRGRRAPCPRREDEVDLVAQRLGADDRMAPAVLAPSQSFPPSVPDLSARASHAMPASASSAPSGRGAVPASATVRRLARDRRAGGQARHAEGVRAGRRPPPSRPAGAPHGSGGCAGTWRCGRRAASGRNRRAADEIRPQPEALGAQHRLDDDGVEALGEDAAQELQGRGVADPRRRAGLDPEAERLRASASRPPPARRRGAAFPPRAGSPPP